MCFTDVSTGHFLCLHLRFSRFTHPSPYSSGYRRHALPSHTFICSPATTWITARTFGYLSCYWWAAVLSNHIVNTSPSSALIFSFITLKLHYADVSWILRIFTPPANHTHTSLGYIVNLPIGIHEFSGIVWRLENRRRLYGCFWCSFTCVFDVRSPRYIYLTNLTDRCIRFVNRGSHRSSGSPASLRHCDSRWCPPSRVLPSTVWNTDHVPWLSRLSSGRLR